MAMRDNREKTLEQVLRETPWRAIVIPFLLSLLVVAVFTFFSVGSVAQEKPVVTFIVVHTGESRALLWNPLTHDEFRQETADGNLMLTVTPKRETGPNLELERTK